MNGNLNLTHTSMGQSVRFESREDVERRQAEVLAVINDIKGQLDRARAANHVTKSFADNDWYLSAQEALKARQLEHQELTRILAALSSAGAASSVSQDLKLEDYVRLHGQHGQERDLPDDLPGCDALENTLLRDIAAIKAQISRAVSKSKASGKYADNHWFTNANSALRIKQATHQALQTHAAGLRKAAKQVEADSFAKYFFEAARALLPKATYMDLLNEAKRLQAEASKNSN